MEALAEGTKGLLQNLPKRSTAPSLLEYLRGLQRGLYRKPILANGKLSWPRSEARSYRKAVRKKRGKREEVWPAASPVAGRLLRG
jgi:hypothetical protein